MGWYLQLYNVQSFFTAHMHLQEVQLAWDSYYTNDFVFGAEANLLFQAISLAIIYFAGIIVLLCLLLLVCVTKTQMQQVIKRAAWKLAFLIRSGLYACHKLTEQKAQLSVVQGYLNVGRVYKYFPYKEAFELSRTWITSPPHCPTLRADCGNLERYICVCVI